MAKLGSFAGGLAGGLEAGLRHMPKGDTQSFMKDLASLGKDPDLSDAMAETYPDKRELIEKYAEKARDRKLQDKLDDMAFKTAKMTGTMAPLLERRLHRDPAARRAFESFVKQSVHGPEAAEPVSEKMERPLAEEPPPVIRELPRAAQEASRVPTRMGDPRPVPFTEEQLSEAGRVGARERSAAKESLAKAEHAKDTALGIMQHYKLEEAGDGTNITKAKIKAAAESLRRSAPYSDDGPSRAVDAKGLEQVAGFLESFEDEAVRHGEAWGDASDITRGVTTAFGPPIEEPVPGADPVPGPAALADEMRPTPTHEPSLERLTDEDLSMVASRTMDLKKEAEEEKAFERKKTMQADKDAASLIRTKAARLPGLIREKRLTKAEAKRESQANLLDVAANMVGLEEDTPEYENGHRELRKFIKQEIKSKRIKRFGGKTNRGMANHYIGLAEKIQRERELKRSRGAVAETPRDVKRRALRMIARDTLTADDASKAKKMLMDPVDAGGAGMTEDAANVALAEAMRDRREQKSARRKHAATGSFGSSEQFSNWLLGEDVLGPEEAATVRRYYGVTSDGEPTLRDKGKKGEVKKILKKYGTKRGKGRKVRWVLKPLGR